MLATFATYPINLWQMSNTRGQLFLLPLQILFKHFFKADAIYTSHLSLIIKLSEIRSDRKNEMKV